MQRTPQRSAGLITMLLVVAGTAIFGCEELPVGVSPTGSPAPGASAGTGTGNGTGNGNGTGTGNAGGGTGNNGNATPTPHPTATPTPAATGSPKVTDPATASFDEPKSDADFTKDQLKILLRMDVPAGVTIKRTQVYYDGVLLASQESSADTMTIANWNPHRVSTSDAKPVPYGSHTLKAVVTTAAGTFKETLFTFEKPLIFKGWVNTLKRNDETLTLPTQAPARSGPLAYANQRRLFSFFGRDANGAALGNNSIRMLNTDMGSLFWSTRYEDTLAWRERAAIAGLNDQVYMIGGALTVGGAPTTEVARYELDRMVAVAAPAFPTAIADASAAVFGNYLYVAGGTTTGDAAGTTAAVYRLQLDSDGRPVSGATWQTDARWNLLTPVRGGALVVADDKLYMVGGRQVNGYDSRVLRLDSTVDNEWEMAGLLPQGVAHMGCVALANELWVFGGETSEGLTAAVTRFSPKTGLYTDYSTGSGKLPNPRAYMGSAVLRDTNGVDRAYLIGGLEPAPSPSPSATPGPDVPTSSVLRADTL